MFTKKQTINIVDVDESKLKEFLNQFNITEYRIRYFIIRQYGIPHQTEIMIIIPSATFDLQNYETLDKAIGELHNENENIVKSFLYSMIETTDEIAIVLHLDGIYIEPGFRISINWLLRV